MVKARLNRKNQLIIILVLGLGLLFLTVVMAFGWHLSSASAITIKMQEMPKYNWIIDEDLGVGEVPGSTPAQIFVVTHPQGWEVLAYCLEPGEEAPPVGTTCELIDENTFWCGDAYQNIRRYQVLQTPPPPPTNTATSTTTSTPTSTSTSTPTSTSLPPTKAPTKKPSATPTARPYMGGSGSNVQGGDILKFGLGFSLFAFGILFLVFNWRRIFFRT